MRHIETFSFFGRILGSKTERRAALCSVTLLAVIIVLSVEPAIAQSTATLQGRVKDSSGAAISGAQVAATESSRGISRSFVTDNDGYYRLPSLPVGTYVVTVERAGFSKSILQGIQLSVDQVAVLDVDLKVGTVEQSVTVTGAVSLVDTDSAAGGTVVENRQVEELPLNGRHFLQLALLVPGVTSSPQGTTQSAWGTVGGGIGFSVSGNRDSYNVFTLDGMNVMDRHYNTITVSPSVDAIQEFKIVANGYSAQYGLLPGAQVDIVTKSGANKYHGSAFEFLRNDKLDAKNYFDDPNRRIPPFKQNQYGFTFGGPIKHDKTFFFINYEGLRVRQTLTVSTLLPTAAMRAGNLSGINPGTGLPFPQVKDPVTGLPFPGNQIPAARINPIAAGILALTPLPNQPNVPAGQFNHIGLGNRSVNNDQFMFRVDHHFTPQHIAFARYNQQHNAETDPFVIRFTPGIAPPEGFGDARGEMGRNFGVGVTSTLTPTLVNEFRWTYNSLHAARKSQNSNSNFLQRLGIPRFGDTLNHGVPFATIPGFAQLGDSDNLQPNIRRNTNVQFKNDMTWIHGRFTHQYGADYRHIKTNGVTDTFSQGEFRFGDERLGFGQTSTGTGFSDFLLDRPRVSLIQLGTGVGSYHFNYFGTYYSLGWHAFPNLSLNVGLRYEFETSPTPIDGTVTSILDLSRGAIILGSESGTMPSLSDPLTQYFITTFGTKFLTNAQAGLPASTNPSNYVHLAPRIGFSWDALSNSKLVVRGAFGIFTNLQERPYETSSNRLGPPFAPTIASFQNSLFVPFFSPLTYENVFLNGGPLDRPSTDGGPSTGGVPPGVNSKYVEQWTAGLQSGFAKDTVAEILYVGSRGIHVNGFLIADQNFPNTAQSPGGFPPDPRYGESFQEHSRGESWYHGVSLRLQRRFAQGLTFTGGYTYSKSEDTVSTFTGGPTDAPVPQNSYDLSANKGLSNFDMRQRFVLSSLYELPFGQGKTFLNQPGVWAALLGNWQVGGVLTLQSGQPFTVQLNGNVSGITSSGADRPNCVADPNSGSRTVSQWFNTAAFILPTRVVPAAGFPYRLLGTCGRNIVTGPPFKGIDTTFAKLIRFKERQELTFRADFFNMTNHPNFNMPDRFFGSSTFGRINSARFPRQIQFGLRYAF